MELALKVRPREWDAPRRSSTSFGEARDEYFATMDPMGNRVSANSLMLLMDQPGFQQSWCYSAPLINQQNQHDNDPEGLNISLTDHERNYAGYGRIAANFPSQTIPIFDLQPHSNLEYRPALAYRWDVGCAISSSLRQTPGADLSLNAGEAGSRYPVKEQSFQQALLPEPQPKSNAELDSILIPYGGTYSKSFSDFEQVLTTGAPLVTQRIRDPRSKSQSKPGRCVRCWALRKPVFLSFDISIDD